MQRGYLSTAPADGVKVREGTSNVYYIEVGPWDSGLKTALLEVAAARDDLFPLPDRRKPEAPESLEFDPTNYCKEISGMKLRIMTGTDIGKYFFARRKRSYWLFAAPDGSDLHHPITRHDSLAGAIGMMANVAEKLETFN